MKVADKVDSQEICFVPGNDYKAFLRSQLGEIEVHRGEIYDVDGNFVAEHSGIELFTIGQRKGLPGGSSRPRYVVDLDPATNRVIVGNAEDLVCDEFEIDRVNWHPVAGIDGSHARGAGSASPLAEGERTEVRGFPSRNGESRQPSPYPLPCEGRGGRTPVRGEDDPRSSFKAIVKIRYSHPGTPASVTPLENTRVLQAKRRPTISVSGKTALVASLRSSRNHLCSNFERAARIFALGCRELWLAALPLPANKVDCDANGVRDSGYGDDLHGEA